MYSETTQRGREGGRERGSCCLRETTLVAADGSITVRSVLGGVLNLNTGIGRYMAHPPMYILPFQMDKIHDGP